MKTNEGGRGARSSWPLYPAFALAAVLTGCATQSGPPLSSLPITRGLSSVATLGGPPNGMVRVVVVRQRPYSFGAWEAAWERSFPVKLDGEMLGELSDGTFGYLDRPAGSHQLSAEFWDWPGVTRRDFTAVSGRTYYFRARLNEKMNDITGVSFISPLGGVIASAATYNDRQGPIDLTPISESEAKQAVAAAQ